MDMLRSTVFICLFLMTIALIDGRSTMVRLSPNLKEEIRDLLNMLGFENEYSRFLSYMKIHPPENDAPMRKIYDEFFSLDAYTNDLIQVYGEYYTAEEIKTLLDFYTSPLGKKTLQMNHDLNKKMEEIMLNKISDYVFTAAEHGFDVPLLQIIQ